MLLFQDSSNKLNWMWFLVLTLPLFSEGVTYQESLNLEDLKSLFGEEDCIEGSLSVTETGDPVIKSHGYMSAVPSVPSTLKAMEKNDTTSDKSPMSLVYELAEFNKIKVQFTLIDEKGPAHKKQFVISLNLGEEEFIGEGPSIKKAQHEASKLALNSTLYGHPPKRIKNNIVVDSSKTPVQKLDHWAQKHNGALVTYSFFEQTHLTDKVSHANYYHSGMYSKAKNIYKAKVTIANQAFIGEGVSQEIAKQNAARNALESLQSVDGFCMLTDKEKSFFNKVFDSNSDNENPISLVHEFGTISNMPVSFDLYSEEGPSHIKKFVFRCNVGDTFETFGEGSSKKSSKRESAQNMILELKRHASFNKINCFETPRKSKSKKKKSKNLVKAVIKSYSEEEEETNYVDLIPEELDSVSKLFQIQQAKHEVLPIFTLLEKSNNEFSIEVTVNDLSAIGTGPNKKLAKKNAARAMLEKMGYLSTHKKDQNFSQKKKKDFSEGTPNKKNIAPGININSNKFHDTQNVKETIKPDSKSDKPLEHKFKLNDHYNHQSKDSLNKKDMSDSQSRHGKSEPHKKSELRPKSKLTNLSQQIGFKFQFSDFPKANNSGFVSLISLTTDPPKVCYGVGETSGHAQDKAALSALGSLYKAQLDHISQILQEENHASPVKTEINFIEEDNVVRSSVAGETD